MKSRTEIVKQFKDHLKITQSKLSKQYRNTKKCQSFYSGDLMHYEDPVVIMDGAGRERRTMTRFNKVKPYVNSVKGFMAQNRKMFKYEARIQRNEIQQLFSKYANGISRYVRENGAADQIETQQDGDLLVNGYGAVETALSYGEGYASNEESGEIIYGRLDPLMVGWDPYARATNLRDKRWVYSCKEYDLKQAKILFNDNNAENFELAVQQESSVYEYFPNGGLYDKIAPYDWVNKEENRVKVYFYQWYDIEPYYKTPNPIYVLEGTESVQLAASFLQNLSDEYEDFDGTSELLTFNGEIKNKLQEYFGDTLGEMFEFKRKVFYTGVISGEHLFTSYKSLSQEDFTIQFKTGDYDATQNIWVGMVNSMMEPSLYYNKALTELMFTIATNSKGGVYVEEDAVEDIAEFEQRYAKTDGIIYVSPGALAKGKIQEKKSPHISTGLDEIINIADKALPDVNGIDPSFLGSREFANDTYAYQRARIKRVMSVLACYFDSANLYSKINARLLLDLMRVFVENNENMTMRIVGEDAQAFFVKLAPKLLSPEFDVSIEETPLSHEDKQEQASLLSSMGDKIIMSDPKAAKVLYGLSIDLMPLDYEKKQKALEVLAPEEGEVDPAYVQQLESQVKELMSQRSEVQLQNIVADSQQKLAKAEEIRAKTVADTQKTFAETAETLESARNKSLESDIIRENEYNDARVII